MTSSDELQDAIEDLRARRPGSCHGWNISDGGVPSSVQLAAWAEDDAAELHVQFPELQLLVGFLRYPERRPGHVIDFEARFRNLPVVDAARVVIALDGPLAVASGRTGHHHLLVTNLGRLQLVVATNGRITGHVIDPATRRIVGISTEAQTLPLVPFAAEPHETAVVPLLVGTASIDPQLGYAVPAGEWSLRAEVSIDGKQSLTPPLQLTILPAALG